MENSITEKTNTRNTAKALLANLHLTNSLDQMGFTSYLKIVLKPVTLLPVEFCIASYFVP